MLSSRLDILHLIATHFCLELVIFFWADASVLYCHGTENRARRVRAEIPEVSDGLSISPRAPSLCWFPSAFPDKNEKCSISLRKKRLKHEMEQNHIFRLQIYFDTQSPSTSKYWTGSSGKQSPPGFKQSINGHKRGKNSSIKPLAPQWRQPPCTLAVTEVSDDSQQACGCLQCRHVVRWICPQSL